MENYDRMRSDGTRYIEEQKIAGDFRTLLHSVGLVGCHAKKNNNMTTVSIKSDLCLMLW